MKILSICVGKPRTITRYDQAIVTGIFKTPVHEPVKVRTLNIDGDRQADLSVHGGTLKAVYVYPSEHYGYWRKRYPQVDGKPGSFGENLTTEGLLETNCYIGDRFRAGTALFQIAQPRMPCFKLAAKFQDDDIIRRFMKSGRSGLYLSVIEEGTIQEGDAIEFTSRDPAAFSIADALQLYQPDPLPPDVLERALACKELPPGMRQRAEAEKN